MILYADLMIDSIFMIPLLLVQPNHTNKFVVKMLSITARQKLTMTLMLTLYDLSIRKTKNLFFHFF